MKNYKEEITISNFTAWMADMQREKGTKGGYWEYDGMTYREALRKIGEEVEADPEDNRWDWKIDAKAIEEEEEECREYWEEE